MNKIPLGDGWFRVERRKRYSKVNTESDDDIEDFVPYKNTKLDAKPTTKTISLEFRNALQLARMRKNYTRKQLALLINEKESVVEAYENGTCEANNNIINKINRVLNTVLPKLDIKRLNI